MKKLNNGWMVPEDDTRVSFLLENDTDMMNPSYEDKYRKLVIEHLPNKRTFIDGGHSYSTVKWDYEQIKDSKVIIFDDTYLEKFPGVAKFIQELRTLGIPITELIEKNDNGKVIMQCAIIINEQETK